MISIARARDLLKHRLVKNAGALVVVQMSAFAAPLLVLPYLTRFKHRAFRTDRVRNILQLLLHYACRVRV